MLAQMEFPLLVFAASLLLLAATIRVSDAFRKRSAPRKDEDRADGALLLSATLTLLYFIVGFTFSMAINRYDARKNCEQVEAVAIGTLNTRADLLLPADAAKVKPLLKHYLGQRIRFYSTRSEGEAAAGSRETQATQAELWSVLRPAVAAIPPPLMGLLITGHNDVVNAQRSTQAAWLNRIPTAAWVLMVGIAVGCCWVIGFRARRTDWLAFMIVPVAASVSFLLIADLDSPRGGVIRVSPQNLAALSQTMETGSALSAE